MKTVFKNDEIPHLWAHRTQPHARGAGSIRFDGDTIYSYAQPIARHAKTKTKADAVLFSSGSWSNTTTGHQNMTRNAIPPGVLVFIVSDVTARNTKEHKANVASYDRTIANLTQRKHRPGSLIAAEVAQRITSTIEQRNAYAVAFGVRCKPMDATQAQTLAASLERAAKRARVKQEKADRERKERYAVEAAGRLLRWRRGASAVPYGSDIVALRAKGDEMQTSRGAAVPLKHARLAFLRVQRCKQEATEWQRNGETIRVGVFQLDAISATGDVRAGCHDIAWTEIERFAKSQGWVK